MQILADRISVGIDRVYVQHAIDSIDELVLDLETYYTVAADVLDLAQQLLPDIEQWALKTAPICKIIRKLRNRKIRHAYNKPNGDPYGGLAYNEKMGPALKLGSPYADFDDPGYYANKRGLDELLQTHLVFWLYNPVIRQRVRMMAKARKKA